MNFFLNTIKYEPEEISEKSDPNKLKENKVADEEMRAKIKEETIKKKS